MSISKLSLPLASGVDFNSGDVDYYVMTDPVEYNTDNRPLKNLAYRDNTMEDKINEIIDALAPSSSYWPHEQSTPDNTLRMLSGFHIKFDGTGLVNKSADFNSGTFSTVTAGKERYDLVTIDDSGTIAITQGSEVNVGTGDPIADSPALLSTKVAIAIIKVDEDTTVVINTADITDAREFLNKGGAMGSYIEQPEINIYRPHEQSTPDATVRVEAGQHIKSDGSGAVIKSTALNSGSFAVVATGNERFDVLGIDDSGSLQITQGVEVLSGAGTPLGNAPDIPSDQVAIAIVEVDEDTTAVINTADITDIREFLNKGGGGGARVLSKREKQTATAGQTVFTLTTMSYNTSDDGLLVLRNGKMLNKDEYTKTSSTVITLVNGAVLSDVLEFIYYYTSTGLEAVAWELFDSHTIGDTVINLSFSYSIGTHQLFVMRNGAMQTIGASYDYTETSTTSITLNDAIVVTDEEIVVFKFSAVQDSMNHSMSFHDDAADILAPGQTYRDLVLECTNSTQVVIKSGTKVLADDWVSAIAFTSDVTVDITILGVKNGLDTGSEAANTWYYIWAIKNVSTGEEAGLFSISATSPTLPSGFTKKRLIGAVRNSGSNFLPFLQVGSGVALNRSQVYSAAITTTAVTVDASGFIPPLSRSFRAMIRFRHAGTLVDAALYAAPSSTGGVIPRSEIGFIDGSLATGIYDASESVISLAENRQFNLWSSANGQYAQVNINGYTLNL